MTGRQPLWAPWRIEYIRSPDGARGCIFCDLRAEPDPVKDRERLVLHRGERVYVLMNRYPYASGHLMVSPYAHGGDLGALPAETLAELMSRIADCSRILQKTYDCEGLNIGANLGKAAGAGFAEHLHFHLVPRWSGDTNFMTAIGEIRVIPEHLLRSYEQLLPSFQELPTP